MRNRIFRLPATTLVVMTMSLFLGSPNLRALDPDTDLSTADASFWGEFFSAFRATRSREREM